MKQHSIKLLFGYELPDNRHNDYHVVDYGHQWDTDLSKFAGPQNSFWFEDPFVRIGNQVQQMTNEYWHYSFYFSLAYVVTIFGLQHWMKERKPYSLRGPLIVWNTLLAIFSIFGVYRCLPEFVDLVYREGVTASYTKSSYYLDYRPTVWYLFFTLSKAVELIDTLFIVLRKSRLIPLHWVHHILTLCFSWFVFPDVPATARWMVNMNFLVHSLMYSYYALKALHVYIPQRVSITITTLQVVQMFFGVFINYQCLWMKLVGRPVDISYSVCLTGCVLYGLFAVMFIHFFVTRYVFAKLPKSASPAAGAEASSKTTTATATSTTTNGFGNGGGGDINHNHVKGYDKKLQ